MSEASCASEASSDSNTERAFKMQTLSDVKCRLQNCEIPKSSAFLLRWVPCIRPSSVTVLAIATCAFRLAGGEEEEAVTLPRPASSTGTAAAGPLLQTFASGEEEEAATMPRSTWLSTGTGDRGARRSAGR